jgi:prepilin-type N-terminal cleavage/methylation domain-containing protein
MNTKQGQGARGKGQEKGLTLLELILALTMLSIILVASGSLNLFVLRAASFNAEETRLQNELEYVFKDMEVYLTDSRLDTETVLDSGTNAIHCVDNGGVCIKLFGPDANDNYVSPLFYDYNVAAKQLSRNGTVLSSDFLIPRPGSPAIFEVRPGSDNKLVQVNLAAQNPDKHGKTITIEGSSRMFFLRGVEPQ